MKIQNNKITFKAGLTRKMKKEISGCNIQKISSEFSKYNIPTDFKNNKTIAWCSLKCLQIIQNLNNKYMLNLGLPNGIFVKNHEDFIEDKADVLGFCNTLPIQFPAGTKKIFHKKQFFLMQILMVNVLTKIIFGRR